jgi:hypothetical protein
MKHLLVVLALVLLLPNVAHSMEGEISTGSTFFSKREDGYWYQSAFVNNLRMTSPSIGIGITDYISDHLKYHVGYKYLGSVRTSAACVGNDAYYMVYGAKSADYLKLGGFYGYGNVNLLYFTLAPEAQFGNYKYAIEIGPTIYRENWIEQGVMFQEEPGQVLKSKEWNYKSHWFIGYTLGASITYKKTSVVFGVYSVDGQDKVQAVFHWLAANLSVRYTF